MIGIKFEDLEFKEHPLLPGVQAVIFFGNGFGASVVRGPWSYGGDRGLYELGVVTGSEKNWSLTYATPITDDVIGFLTEDGITNVLRKIADLPSENWEPKQ